MGQELHFKTITISLISKLQKDYLINNNRSVNRYMHEMILHIPTIINPKYFKAKDYDNLKLNINLTSIPKFLGNNRSFLGNIIGFAANNIFKKYEIAHNFYFNVGIRAHKTITTVYDLREFKGTFIEKWTAKQWLKSDYLIAISSQTKQELVKKGYDKDRIFVVNLGINPEYLVSIPTRNSINKPFFKVGYIGTFEKNKNILSFVNAVNNANLDGSIIFCFYGVGGTEEEKIKNAIDNDGHKYSNIILYGWLPEDKIVKTYDSFDAFIFPSLYEGFGLPIIEAQARGLPVIILKHAKIPKEIRKFCLEAESPEHMVRIIEDLKKNGYNEKQRAEALKYARSFTWDRCAKETVEVYFKVINQGIINKDFINPFDYESMLAERKKHKNPDDYGQKLPINIKNNFIDGESAVFFNSGQQLKKKFVKYFLKSNEWQEIAKKGYKHYHKYHTPECRAQTLINYIKNI